MHGNVLYDLGNPFHSLLVLVNNEFANFITSLDDEVVAVDELLDKSCL
jgi:hypothetical protein